MPQPVRIEVALEAFEPFGQFGIVIGHHTVSVEVDYVPAAIASAVTAVDNDPALHRR